MKTAISIDDMLLHRADETARSLGVSRSRLFALAMTDFLKRKKNASILRDLNEVYAGDTPDRALLRGIKATAGRTLKDRW